MGFTRISFRHLFENIKKKIYVSDYFISNPAIFHILLVIFL